MGLEVKIRWWVGVDGSSGLGSINTRRTHCEINDGHLHRPEETPSSLSRALNFNQDNLTKLSPNQPLGTLEHRPSSRQHVDHDPPPPKEMDLINCAGFLFLRRYPSFKNFQRSRPSTKLFLLKPIRPILSQPVFKGLLRPPAETKGGVSEGPVRRIERSLILIPAATCKRKLCPLSKGHDGRSRRLENGWFGQFLEHGNGWIYHRIVCLFVFGQATLKGHSQERRWFWSTQDLYPYIYQADQGSWLYIWESPKAKASFQLRNQSGRV